MSRNIMSAAFAALIASLCSCSQQNNYAAMGSFEATEITISAESTGKILSFDVEEGDDISAGEVVGTIDTVQLYLQKLMLGKQVVSVQSNKPVVEKQIAALKDQIEKAEKERRRVKNLLEDGAATTKQLDDVESQLSVLKSQLDASRTALLNSSAAVDANSSAIELQIAQIDDKLAKSRIASPISGKVLAKYAEAGEFTAMGKPLMKVADVNKMYLRAYFTSDQLASVSLGQKVKVTADFGGDQQKEYEGTVTWISEESEFTPKTIQTRDSRANLVYAVKIAVENDGNLKIGFAGTVSL